MLSVYLVVVCFFLLKLIYLFDKAPPHSLVSNIGSAHYRAQTWMQSTLRGSGDDEDWRQRSAGHRSVCVTGTSPGPRAPPSGRRAAAPGSRTRTRPPPPSACCFPSPCPPRWCPPWSSGPCRCRLSCRSGSAARRRPASGAGRHRVGGRGLAAAAAWNLMCGAGGSYLLAQRSHTAEFLPVALRQEEEQRPQDGVHGAREQVLLLHWS